MLPQLPAKCKTSRSLPGPAASEQEPISVAKPAQPRPILCLSAASQQLYVELIDTSLDRSGGQDTIWVRPLYLVERTDANRMRVCNLQHTSDLLWPAQCFSQVYAEDLLPLIPQAVEMAAEQSGQVLRAFVQKAWQEGWPR